MYQHTEEELKKLTKAELIDHIVDVEGILARGESFRGKLKEVGDFCQLGIDTNHHLMRDCCEGERLYALAQLRVYKKLQTYVKIKLDE